MRSLYARLLVAFLAVLALSTTVLYRGYRAMTTPQIVAMISGSQNAQASEAEIAVQQGGLPGLRDYLSRLDAVTQLPHYVVDANGRDVLNGQDRTVFLPADKSGDALPHVDPVGDRTVFITPFRSGYRLVTLAPIPFRVSDFVPSVLLVTAAVIVLFWLLVADLVRPLTRLAEAVQHFGRGDFGARAPIKRHDEIGRLAAVFNEMARRIEDLVTSERRLLQDVSHELRSPLTRLNIGIELLRTATDRDEAANRLQREASRLSDLVATLLEVVRLEGDPGSAPMSAIDPMEILRGSADDCGLEAAGRQVRIVITGDTLDTLTGNPELLRRAFDNIIGNAARYAPTGTCVTVLCSRSVSEQTIEVRDRGPGVGEEQLPHLGDAFYRADESRSSTTGGVGLGLAIARRAIHLHRGSLEITNANPGLCVTIRLPLKAAAR
jgi:signal transduction histidine kinase